MLLDIFLIVSLVVILVVFALLAFAAGYTTGLANAQHAAGAKRLSEFSDADLRAEVLERHTRSVVERAEIAAIERKLKGQRDV